MILSNIVSNNKKICMYKFVKLLNLLKKIKKTNIRLQVKKKFLLKHNNLKQSNKNLIVYVINVVLSSTNSLVNVVDLEGNVLISISAGSLNLTKFQKKTQPMALLSIFKVLLLKAKFLKNRPIALHFKNVKRFHESFFINILKTKLFIQSFQSYNLVPHNGCRPKKIKKIKIRTKRLILK